MKIAMIGQKGVPATYGGVERHVEELGARFVGMGHDVTVYCRRHYTRDVREHRGMRLRILPSLNTKHLDTLSHTALAVADSMRRRFDIVHFHAIGPAGFSFLPRMLCPRRTRVIATVHALDWRRRKWGGVARRYLRWGAYAACTFPHRTLVVSREMEAYFAERGAKVVYIPNGVEPPQPTPIGELRQFIPEGRGFLLWMGRFVPEKRVEDLIRAFRTLPVDRMLLLAGETDSADPYFKSLKTAAGDDERIIFSGGLYGQAKAEALSNAELVILPSELEGFPIALLEAMRYARPVLASDIPEHLEAVQPDFNGFVFPVGNYDALAQRIAWVLQHPQEADAAAQYAQETAREYDWDTIARLTVRIYEHALA